MANENVKKFEELLRTDEELQAKLKDAVEAYEGAKDDARTLFDATVGKLAEEAGLPFSFEEGRAFAAEGAEINDAELDAVAGGTAVCYIFGGSDEGSTGTCAHDEQGAGACKYLGVTFETW